MKNSFYSFLNENGDLKNFAKDFSDFFKKKYKKDKWNRDFIKKEDINDKVSKFEILWSFDYSEFPCPLKRKLDYGMYQYLPLDKEVLLKETIKQIKASKKLEEIIEDINTKLGINFNKNQLLSKPFWRSENDWKNDDIKGWVFESNLKLKSSINDYKIKLNFSFQAYMVYGEKWRQGQVRDDNDLTIFIEISK